MKIILGDFLSILTGRDMETEDERIARETALTGEKDRLEGFKAIISEYRLKVGVEIGVREANFSRFLLENTKLEKLYGIDYNMCENAVKLEKEYKGRYTFIHAKSPECSTRFPNNSFDFIHIDAGHKYHDAKADMEHWWSKLKTGGCFSGDDYMDYYAEGEGQFGVMRALHEFCDKEGVKFNIIGCNSPERFRKVEFGEYMGAELKKRVMHQANKFILVPNWWLIKQ